MKNLSKNKQIIHVGSPVALGSSIDDNSTRIDMSKYESVTFICSITDSVDTGVAGAEIQGNSADSDTGMAAITGTAVTATSGANDDLNNKLFVLEYHRSEHQFIQLTRSSSVANIAFGDVVAILTPYQVPVVEDASIQDSSFTSN